MRIKSYVASKKPGNTIGFLNIEIDTIINDVQIPEALEVTIMRNSHNGHLFISWPSRQYTAPDGNTRYAPLVRWPKEKYEFIQQEVIKQFNEYIARNKSLAQQEAPLSQGQNHATYQEMPLNGFVEQLPF